jgi:hypothetical protein
LLLAVACLFLFSLLFVPVPCCCNSMIVRLLR